MKKVVLAVALILSGFVVGQEDSLLSESELYDVLHADDIPGYMSSKSGDNDFQWSHGLLEHIFTDPSIRYIYGATNPRINNLLVNRDFGIVKKEPMPFTYWIETELNLSDYPDDRYVFKYKPTKLKFGQYTETLSIFDKDQEKWVRCISITYSPMEYDKDGNWVEVSEYKNIANFADSSY